MFTELGLRQESHDSEVGYHYVVQKCSYQLHSHYHQFLQNLLLKAGKLTSYLTSQHNQTKLFLLMNWAQAFDMLNLVLHLFHRAERVTESICFGQVRVSPELRQRLTQAPGEISKLTLL